MNAKNSYTKLNSRKDGAATKALIIECAGRLIAAHGYSDTTSKMICETAKTNQAAVNYHFGSRENLYTAVLEEVHQHLLRLDFLNELLACTLSPQAKLERFIDALTASLEHEDNWYAVVWAREIINPSPCIETILAKEARPKFNILKNIFSQITGLDENNPKLYVCMLSVMAPFVLLFLANRNIVKKVIAAPAFSPPELAAQLKEFVFAGLKEYMALK